MGSDADGRDKHGLGVGVSAHARQEAGHGRDVLWEPIAPSVVQWIEARRTELTGAQRLYAAVLEEAMNTLRTHTLRDTPRSVELVAQTWDWIDGRGHAAVPFEMACEAIRLEPSAFRRGLKAWTPDPQRTRMFLVGRKPGMVAPEPQWSDRLLARRRRRGWSQKQAARQLSMSHTMLGHYERRNTHVPPLVQDMIRTLEQDS